MLKFILSRQFGKEHVVLCFLYTCLPSTWRSGVIWFDPPVRCEGAHRVLCLDLLCRLRLHTHVSLPTFFIYLVTKSRAVASCGLSDGLFSSKKRCFVVINILRVYCHLYLHLSLDLWTCLCLIKVLIWGRVELCKIIIWLIFCSSIMSCCTVLVAG